ncbi:MAG: nucleotidyltransferase domain-containing protein [Oscillospiraceae bacterium]|nr:nucleotidyltransferase domain-containing protein [Oscillospiraceae bacterium]
MEGCKELNNDEINGIVDIILGSVPAQEIYIFGSQANGTARDDSDYDFYVVIPDDGLHAIEATWKITSAMRNRTRNIDMLIGTRTKFDKYKNTTGFIESEVIKTGVKLYG